MKLNKAVIGAIVTELTTIGQANLKLAEYVKTLGEDAPEIEEVLPPVTGKAKTPKAPKAAVIEPEVVEDDEEEVADLEAMTLKQLKALADENGVEYPSKVKKDALIELLSAATEEEEDEDEVEADEDGEEEEEEIDLESMTAEELVSFIEENLDGVEAPKKKKTQKAAAYKAALIELIEEHLGEEEEEEADEEEDEESDEDEVSTVIETEDGDVDLAEMNVKQLKKFAKDYEIEVSAKDKDGLIEEILEAIYADEEEADEAEEEDEDEDEEEVDIAEELGLNDMDTTELAEILEEHGLSTKGKKQALIARIVEAVEDGTIEMDDEEEGE